MRSNIARTCGSGSVPRSSARGSALVTCRAPGRLSGRGTATACGDATDAELLQRRQEVDHLLELLRVLPLKLRVRGHRRGRIDERAGDRLAGESRPHLGQLGPDLVSVLADLVAAETPRRRGHALARLIAGRLHGDLRGR